MDLIKEKIDKAGQKVREDNEQFRHNPELDKRPNNPGAERKRQRAITILQSVKKAVL